jgi:hypothetical protein
LLAVQGRNEGQAGVEGTVSNTLPHQFADYDGAGTAVTGSAAIFRPGFAQMFTQIIEYGDVRVELLLGAQLSVE